ncbi:cytoplasmic tRNA 2-thiolation protein 2 [Centruroides vittatus]|uniref:cytoplasmic tRNA 2-thiolation protein 2 n=1 Tax=Centruroides vittatus TaxID=120091 RepID=UPI0035109673
MCSVEDGNETVEIKTNSCFLAYCTHKFRGTLGKSKQIKRGEKILIAFSGGMSSSAMLHMIKEGLKEASHKRLSFNPILLFIDETSIFSTINDDNEEIYKIMLDTRFPSYITRLEMVYHDEKSVFYQSLDASYFNFINYNKEKKLLMEALDSFKSLSSKENFIKNLRYNLIMDIAKNVDCSKIFVGESATLLAIRLLSDLAQGCGANISDETVKEFLNKEIAMYNHFLNIPYQVKQTLSTKSDNKASILRLTENFVVGLQSQFPATVSTIYRIGNKLCADSDKISKNKCILCQKKKSIKCQKYILFGSILTRCGLKAILKNPTEVF